MDRFWPSFFLFLFAVLLLFALAQPDMLLAALGALGGILIILAWLLVGAAVLTGLLIAVLAWRKFNLSARRPVDGAFPLQQYRLRDGRTLLVNPNTMISPAAIVDRASGYEEVAHPAGWQIVAQVRQAVERTNSIRAMFPGDAVRANPHGAMSDVPRVNASTMRAIDAQSKQWSAQPETIDVQPSKLVHSVTVHDAMHSARGAQLPLGQDVQTGEIVHVDFSRSVHVRFHGATQDSGKTNACKTLLVGALRAGWHVVICDRRRFKDFHEFKDKAELIAVNDPERFVHVLKRLVAIYQYRDRKLADSGKTNAGAARDMQRILCMVSEFGALCVAAKAEGQYQEMVQPLTLIMREAGSTGIHLVFEDQVIERGAWPGAVVGNSAAYVGRMPSRAGQTVGYYHSDKLPSYHFYNDGVVAKTWDMSKATRQLLATVPAYQRSVLTAPQSVREGVREGVRQGVRQGVRPEVDPLHEHFTNIPNEQGKWYDFVRGYMDRYPALYDDPPKGVRALARAMARADTGSDKTASRYVGIASETARLIREARPETGAETLASMGIDWNDVTIKGRKL